MAKQMRHDEGNVFLLENGGLFPVQGSANQKYIADLSLKAMNLIGYSAMNLGWTELSMGVDQLKEMTSTASFPLVTSNLVYKKNQQPIGKKYIIRQAGDVKVGIIGIMPLAAVVERSRNHDSHDNEGCAGENVKDEKISKLSANSLTEQVEMIPPEKAVNEVLSEIRDKVNIVILLSQYPLETTRAIANSTPGIDLAISSPAKKWVADDEKKHQVPVMLTPYGGRSLGSVKFTLDDTGKILEHKEKTIRLNDLVVSDEQVVQITSNDIKDKIKQEEARKMEAEAKALLKLTPYEYYEKLMEAQSENTKLKGDEK